MSSTWRANRRLVSSLPHEPFSPPMEKRSSHKFGIRQVKRGKCVVFVIGSHPSWICSCCSTFLLSVKKLFANDKTVGLLFLFDFFLRTNQHFDFVSSRLLLVVVDFFLRAKTKISKKITALRLQQQMTTTTTTDTVPSRVHIIEEPLELCSCTILPKEPHLRTWRDGSRN